MISTPAAPAMHIRTYQKTDQDAVIELVLAIQQHEFGVNISQADQPDLLSVPEYYQRGHGQFWVAEYGGDIIGTLGLLDIGQQMVALRKMFVTQAHRGSERAVAQKLLTASLIWCQQHGVTDVYLGTINVYHAAIRFYEKNGFRPVDKQYLPKTFPLIAVDDVFFQKRLTETHKE